MQGLQVLLPLPSKCTLATMNGYDHSFTCREMVVGCAFSKCGRAAHDAFLQLLMLVRLMVAGELSTVTSVPLHGGGLRREALGARFICCLGWCPG